MDTECFKIYVEQLRDGHVEKIDESIPSDFLGVQEKDLEFRDKVKVQGEAYLADDVLILHLNMESDAIIPCSICNKPVAYHVVILGLYHMEPLENIKAGIFYFNEIVREAILLETPRFTECENGQCPARKEISRYLKEPSASSNEEAEGFKPFADFDFEKKQ